VICDVVKLLSTNANALITYPHNIELQIVYLYVKRSLIDRSFFHARLYRIPRIGAMFEHISKDYYTPKSSDVYSDSVIV
jgi:hypothetical protein